MPTYAVRVEREAGEPGIWNTVVPDTVVADPRNARDLCDEIAFLQTVADGHRWRVRAWHGEAADDREPDGEQYIKRSV